MATTEHFEELHDKATRGVKLSAAESAELEAWYARQDLAEAQTLAIQRDKENPANLQKGIETALAQLGVVASHVQKTTAENQALRQEITDLRRQLAQQTALEPA